MKAVALFCFLVVSFQYVNCKPKKSKITPNDNVGIFMNNEDFDTGRRILNGEATSIAQHPYQVYLLLKDDEKNEYTCGGSIISPEWVVTAAHCMVGMYPALVRAGSSLRTKGGVERKPLVYFHHEGYNEDTHDFDVGLVKIDPLDYDTYIQPIGLPDENEEVKPGEYIVSGWGKDDTGTLPIRLRDVTVNLVNYDVCNKDYNHELTDHMICAGTGGKDSCSGDSGGPLVQNNELIGIVSFGAGCGGLPGVYVKVSKVRDWIQSHTGI